MGISNGAASLSAVATSGSLSTRRDGGGGERVDGSGGLAECDRPTPMADLQRARILAAMAEVCAERGAANVTVAHVVDRSGVSRRTFYELFEDREDCLLAALEQALACVGSYVLPAYDAHERWVDRIRAALLAALEFLDEEPYMGRLLLVETLGGGARALGRRQQALAAVVAAVDEGRLAARSSTELSRLTAEGVVGGVLSVLHGRLLEAPGTPLRGLAGQLMSMIVLPYLGASAARRELGMSVPAAPERGRGPAPANTLRALGMRLTYRTVRVLRSVAENPGSSNREVAANAEIHDQGQTSKLLTRLERLGLIENRGAGSTRGAPNAWSLTAKGQEVREAIGAKADAKALAAPGSARRSGAAIRP